MSRQPKSLLAVEWLREHGGSFQDAAEKFGISKQGVQQQWSRRYPGEPPPSTVASSGRVELIRNLAATHTAAEIAADTGLTESAVRSFCKWHSITPQAVVYYTEQQLADVVAGIKAGKRISTVSRETGVRYRYIRKMIADGRAPKSRGERRRHGGTERASAYMDQTGCSLDEAAIKHDVAPPTLFVYRNIRGLRTRRK